jgi:hypothetical protein
MDYTTSEQQAIDVWLASNEPKRPAPGEPRPMLDEMQKCYITKGGLVSGRKRSEADAFHLWARTISSIGWHNYAFLARLCLGRELVSYRERYEGQRS